LLQRRPEGIVQGLLGEVEVTEQPDQSGENAPRLGAVDRLHRFADSFDRFFTHLLRSLR
jgi:hypothetical protein